MGENYVVIMAGGVGSRFWPMSSEEMPKQFLDILGCGRTLLQMTFDRFTSICSVKNFWVVTSERYANLVHEQLPEIPEQQILKEPCRRNTAPCIAYVSWAIKAKNSCANIVVTPSDHVIVKVPEFVNCVSSCLSFSSETDSIVTIGIKPDHPETGYGYIQADLSYASPANKNIFRVNSFKEKPDYELAKLYIKENNFFWNSGIFIWNINTIINALRVYQPVLSKQFEDLRPYYATDKESQLINEVYPKCENISIDYAIMEKAGEVYVYPANFGWSDLGTWSSLKNHLSQDIHGNACVGQDVRLFETNDCMIHTSQEKQVVVQGLNGYVVVEKDGILLICKLSEEQRIKLFH
ncbi:MAG: mannose-1-phosphate guanylyltransferase [Bacteroidaceae bacterium]|nr:mannose-1-phosphate guanylyltransferase [Bacteroidaceae bacterium]